MQPIHNLFKTIETHSSGTYIANQAANPFGVVFHDLPERIDIYVDNKVLQASSFPDREKNPEVLEALTNFFTRQGVYSAIRNEKVDDSAFIYTPKDGSGLARLKFTVEAKMNEGALSVNIGSIEE